MILPSSGAGLPSRIPVRRQRRMYHSGTGKPWTKNRRLRSRRTAATSKSPPTCLEKRTVAGKKPRTYPGNKRGCRFRRARPRPPPTARTMNGRTRLPVSRRRTKRRPLCPRHSSGRISAAKKRGSSRERNFLPRRGCRAARKRSAGPQETGDSSGRSPAGSWAARPGAQLCRCG